MAHRTPLFEVHLAHGGQMVEFSGWEMPIHYGSQIEEHHAVRRNAGIFDVSHMGVVDLYGSRVRDFLRYLLANDVARLDGRPGKALYSCLLNPQGGVIDDLIVTYLTPDWYRMVINAGCRNKDLRWLRDHAADFDIEIVEQSELAMVAVQGPTARAAVHTWLGRDAAEVVPLSRFAAVELAGQRYITRTGYTGEDGYEIILPADDIEELWHAMTTAGVRPCGLGARDTLRLEAGMNLYGHEMDESTNPLESGLKWTISLDDPHRTFIGREAVVKLQQSGVSQRLTGLLLNERGVLRAGQHVYLAGGTGTITSGTFSPTLQRAIAFARLPIGDESVCEVEIRGRRHTATITPPPFVRNGQSALPPSIQPLSSPSQESP
jgi:aminomethyltransferase